MRSRSFGRSVQLEISRAFSAAPLTHPLEPLSVEETNLASSIVRKSVGVAIDDDPNLEKLRFVAVSLREPAKTDLQLYNEGKDIKICRKAEIITLNPLTGLASEYVVDLDKSNIIEQKILPEGTQPMFTPEDCELAEAIVQTSPEVADALRERYGITDMSRIACDPWSINLASDEDIAMINWREDGIPGRLVQTFLYHRQYGDEMQDNHYAHPIDILPVVDLNARKVVKIGGLDRRPPKIPTDSVNYHRDLVKTNSYLQTTWRSDTVKALDILQEEGPSFKVSDGHLVEWQKWSFRVGFNYREGLVLYDLKFDGRPVMNRGSLVEMAVPYADPYPPHQRKCAFDVGDYGLGYCANSLELGCDCLGHIHYFDAVLSKADGTGEVKKKAICMHEEDVGILWKHVEYRNGHNESRRSRELVISSIATVVNYEYLFYWRLKQDGMIDFEIKLSGELSTNLLSATEEKLGRPTHGVTVSPGVNSQIHQHMFCMRLDMAVDGLANTVSEVDVVSQPVDDKNPYGNAFGAVETVLESEKRAIRTADMTRARSWKISNSSGKRNRVNQKPTAYKLLPFTRGPAHPVMLTDPTSSVSKKGAFALANLWVTPHSDSERYPAGEYTPQGDGSVGVQDWTQSDRNLVGQDLILWHAFGVTHIPRAEDFPVMPCESTGFTLKPDNFFDGNPAIDIPPQTNKASKLAPGCCSTK